MFDKTKVAEAYKHIRGWRPHFNNQIQINAANQETDTGEYWGDEHPALRLDYIVSTLSQGQNLDKYLAEKVDVATTLVFNDVLTKRQVDGYGKTLLQSSQLLNKYGWTNDKIVNRSRFVGLRVRIQDVTGLQMLIDEIGLQLTVEQEVEIYIFHSSQVEPVKTITVTSKEMGWAWKTINQTLASAAAETFYGGVFIVGYYQDDLVGQAINYSNFNWDKGECGGCGGSSYYDVWQAIKGFYQVYPVYVPQGKYKKGKMFDLNDMFFDNKTSWGLNLKFSVTCDLTQFFISNKFVFKKLMGLKVATLVLQDMKFSQETNFVQEDLKNMVIRELEGDKETNALNIVQQYSRELKAVSFNMSGINNRCLPCEGSAWKPDISYV